ncbi:hypothetical protein [Pontibacter populi]|uniref:Uncharacterized protein n=1 Tax=Pontibacter populi TaxID=890055 RepID=A0ABV1RVF4_9BACT
MKRFALTLIVLISAIAVFNLTQLNYADLTADNNYMLYLNLAGNILILISLVISYVRLSKETIKEHNEA